MSNKIDIIVSAIDRVTAPLRRINTAVHGFTAPIARVNGGLVALHRESGLSRIAQSSGNVVSAMSNVKKEAGALAAKLTVLGGSAAWLIKTQLIDTASEFERYRTILETVEGSSEKAQQSLDWVSDFAARTPFELGEVTDAFVKLRAYGLDPTNGLLRTLGDTGAAMGMPITMAVEAITAAVTGEYEQLKKFGVKASTKGNKVSFDYTDKDGKQQAKTVDNRNRAMIQSTLEAIWNEKYSGAMEKQSKTWLGMVSNMADQWTRFKNMIMKAGVFDWLKGNLEKVLAMVDRMAEDGSLAKLANDIGGKLKTGLVAAWQAGVELVRAVRAIASAISWLANLVGGWQNLMVVVGVFMAGKLVFAILAAAAAFKTLGIAIAVTPVGWIMLAVVAIAGLVYLIYKNWGPIGAWWGRMWAKIKPIFTVGFEVIKALFSWSPLGLIMKNWEPIKTYFSGLLDWLRGAILKVSDIMPDWMKKYTLPGIAISNLADAVRPTGAAQPTAGMSTQRTDVGGTVHIKIDSEGRPRAKVASSNRNVGFAVDAGYTMVMP